MRLRAIALLAVALATVACGTTGGSTPKKPKVPAPTVPRPLPVPPAPAAGDVTGQTVAAIRKSFDALPGYGTEIRWYQKAGTKSASGLYHVAGKPPRTLQLLIKTGSSEGSKVLWTGGDHAKVRPGGFLSVVSVNLPVTDDRLIGLRGYTIGEMDLAGLLGLLSNPANRVSIKPTTPDVVTIFAEGPALLQGCRTLTAVFDAKTLYPRSVSLADAKEDVVRMTMSDFKPMRHGSLDI